MARDARRSDLTVLLVEDNPGDARLIQEALADTMGGHCTLVHVDRLSAAQHRLAVEPFDVILLDLQLPDSSGITTFDRVQAGATDVPVVVLTGLSDEGMAMQAVQRGAQDYLVKGDVEGDGVMRALRYAVERHRVLAATRTLSITDDLTGLCNRRGFTSLAEQHLRHAQRSEEPFLVFFVDLDGLKPINDTYGHQYGSAALIETAQVLTATFRESDIIARLGGDEFSVLATNADLATADRLRVRLKETLDLYNRRAGRTYELSISVGVAEWTPGHPATLHELLELADARMYQEKRAKKAERLSVA
jgi:two-component system, cell cycle response regulator